MNRPQTDAAGPPAASPARMGLWARIKRGLSVWMGLYGGCACRTLPGEGPQCDARQADKNAAPTVDPSSNQNKCL